LDRYKEENEELRASLTQITQSYLLEKAQVEDLRAKVGSLSSGSSNHQRNIDRIVENQVALRCKEMQAMVQQQKLTIEKYKKYKICLSKNVYELQDRLKATRQELHQTQRQLFSLQ
jgi:chromosome segregation ATPase